MRRLVLVSATLASFIATPAIAQQWQMAARAGPVTGFVDRASVRRTGNRVRYWAELRYATPQTGGTVRFERVAYLQDVATIHFDRVQYYQEADCIERRYRVLRSISWFERRMVQADGAEGRNHHAERGSLADMVLNVACTFGPTPRDNSGDQRIRTTAASWPDAL
jgi:hypothetical protein